MRNLKEDSMDILFRPGSDKKAVSLPRETAKDLAIDEHK